VIAPGYRQAVCWLCRSAVSFPNQFDIATTPDDRKQKSITHRDAQN